MASSPIRIGIAGYGNLGRGAQAAIAQHPDMQLVGIFTRRNPAALVQTGTAVPVWSLDAAADHRDDIDVLILCGGSKDDLPAQGPQLARWFTTVDSYDTHARIPDYFEALDAAAKAGGNLSILAVGWDPGLFSINRLMGEAILPQGGTYTFWGKGLSQGHSDAIRRVPGVAGGVQYTIPVPQAVQRVRSGQLPQLSTREKHTRECFVVLQPGADAQQVEHTIVSMPDYFVDYDTTVHFIDADTLQRDHAGMPHGGFVIRSGISGQDNAQVIEYSLNLSSNPGFTSSVLVAYARAAWRLKLAGDTGARSVFDVAPGLLSPKSAADLRRELL
ncbi:diaminopimelate dehydrogenase [Castellaniella sp.]|uniref:diaminopimelate dehydrogenase n=1 Tax=Castellaniella sp. TaxID=1955812 RepID=UPI002AFE0E52|nr:diaminopimelate dehydrogenase [Castellaniella sp.]